MCFFYNETETYLKGILKNAVSSVNFNRYIATEELRRLYNIKYANLRHLQYYAEYYPEELSNKRRDFVENVVRAKLILAYLFCRGEWYEDAFNTIKSITNISFFDNILNKMPKCFSLVKSKSKAGTTYLSNIAYPKLRPKPSNLFSSVSDNRYRDFIKTPIPNKFPNNFRSVKEDKNITNLKEAIVDFICEFRDMGDSDIDDAGKRIGECCMSAVESYEDDKTFNLGKALCGVISSNSKRIKKIGRHKGRGMRIINGFLRFLYGWCLKAKTFKKKLSGKTMFFAKINNPINTPSQRKLKDIVKISNNVCCTE